MASLNNVQLIGNLGTEPVTRYTNDGRPICNLTLATNEKWKDKTTGELKESTEWHHLVFMAKLAEVANLYLKKGQQIFVEGRLRTHKWSKEGVDHFSTQIFVRKLIMLGKRAEDIAASSTQQAYQKSSDKPAMLIPRDMPPIPQGVAAFDDMDDDIPF